MKTTCKPHATKEEAMSKPMLENMDWRSLCFPMLEVIKDMTAKGVKKMIQLMTREKTLSISLKISTSLLAFTGARAAPKTPAKNKTAVKELLAKAATMLLG